jgi:hypothetical protein
VLRQVLAAATQRGFAIHDVATQAVGSRRAADGSGLSDGSPPLVEVTLHVQGRAPVTELAAALSELNVVDAVLATDASVAAEESASLCR